MVDETTLEPEIQEKEHYEGILVARPKFIEDLTAPFRRGKDKPITVTLSVSIFDVEQLANILPSTGADF